ncbi:MAG TPA: hypothetical protein VKZ97_10905 [Flavobacteriaceae bacterium]|nr:hypothetical protein [Flavobacteriaceae bacterium]
MTDIVLTYNYRQLEALNCSWELLDSLNALTPQDKAMLSCVRDLKIKFQNKQNTLQYKFQPGSTYKITLKTHEAYLLELYWRVAFKAMPLGYERVIVNTFADKLNRKLA